MPEYVTAYEYGISSILHFVLVFAFFAISGVVVAAIAISRLRRTGSRLGVAVILFSGMFAALGGGFGLVVVLSRHIEAVRSYHARDYQVVEGQVRVLRTQPAGGHGAGDLIAVSGRELEIDFFSTAPGYRQTIANGGILQDGRQVRLYVHQGNVLRVDVAP